VKGTIDFRYDRENDVIVATPHWNLQTEEDARVWYQQYMDYLEQNFPGRRMDMVLELTDFQIAAPIAAKWGEYRARIHKAHTRYSYRVNSSSRVRLYVNTSGVRYDASTEEAASVEDGLEAIREARRRDGVEGAGAVPAAPDLRAHVR